MADAGTVNQNGCEKDLKEATEETLSDNAKSCGNSGDTSRNESSQKMSANFQFSSKVTYDHDVAAPASATNNILTSQSTASERSDLNDVTHSTVSRPTTLATKTDASLPKRSGQGTSISNPAIRSAPMTTSTSHPQSLTPQSKLDVFRSWSLNTYKCTRQMLSERLGRSSRTLDLELELEIESLRENHKKYLNILRLSRALSSHFHNVVQTQRALGESFTDMSQKNQSLHDEFSYNAETQKILCLNGERLLAALHTFTSGVNTLCNKAMDDTLITIKQFETARLEFDAYKNDFAAAEALPKNAANAQRLDAAKRTYLQHKEKYERLRNDVSIKIKFLDENKVKVMHKNLVQFHNAIAAYFSGNQTGLQEALKNFNITLKPPNAERPSWLEKSS